MSGLQTGLTATCVALVLGLAGCGPDRKGNDMQESIGSARMDQNGVITLQLRATAEGGVVGDATFEYRPGDKQYDDVRRHVGGLAPGEEKPVPPWK